MNGTIDLHRNNKVSIADGLQEETTSLHIITVIVIRNVDVLPQPDSRGPASNTKNIFTEEEDNGTLFAKRPPPNARDH